MTHRSGMSAGASTVVALPFTVSLMAWRPILPRLGVRGDLPKAARGGSAATLTKPLRALPVTVVATLSMVRGRPPDNRLASDTSRPVPLRGTGRLRLVERPSAPGGHAPADRAPDRELPRTMDRWPPR